MNYWLTETTWTVLTLPMEPKVAFPQGRETGWRDEGASLLLLDSVRPIILGREMLVKRNDDPRTEKSCLSRSRRANSLQEPWCASPYICTAELAGQKE